jgi:uracil-DNA glycosylase
MSSRSAREELLALTRQVKEHAAWLERGGVVGVPKKSTVDSRPPAARPAPAKPAATGANVGATGLAVVREELGDCQRCKLAGKRTNIVFGVGNPEAALVFVGEAPGADEDRTGEPFVGAAGQLLTKMIEAMGLARGDVYICNILKCRPPGNRNPEPDEIEQCEPFLKKQLAAIRPRMIVALGKFAAQCLLRSDAPISKLRGAWREYEGIPLMPTYHPAFLLRTPSAKREVWNDLQQVMAELDRLGIPRARR